MKCFSQNAQQQLLVLFLTKKKPSLNKGHITFYKLFIPSLTKKRSDWAHHFLQKARRERGIKSRSLSPSVRQKTPELVCVARVKQLLVVGKSLGRSLMRHSIREQPPTWLHSFGEELWRGKEGIWWRNLRRRAGLNIFQVGQAEASQHTVASAQAECLCKRQMFQEQISSWINFLPKGTTSPTTQAELDTITRPALSLLPTEFLK